VDKINVPETLEATALVFVVIEELIKQLDRLGKTELADALRFLLPIEQRRCKCGGQIKPPIKSSISNPNTRRLGRQ
jgi:hypothetical protein